MMSNVIQDIRYAARQLRKSPGFAFTAIAVLALGLGANVAVFTLLDGILLRPLPYARPAQLVTVAGPDNNGFTMELSYADMKQLADAAGSRVETGAVLNGGSMVSVVGPAGRFQVKQELVTAGLLPMLGVQPVMGRSFRNEENDPGRERVLVVSDAAWHKLWNADAQVVGKTLTINGVIYSVIGVMPKGFAFPYGEDVPQLWSPVAIDATARTKVSGDGLLYGEMFARLPEGMKPGEFAANLNRTQAAIVREVPSDNGIAKEVQVTDYQSKLNHRARQPLTLLYVVVVGIWALACLNVTSLMLARAVARGRELAVRSALGASRSRLMQQTIVESLMLSCVGSGIGLLLGQVMLKVLWRQIERNLPLTPAVYLEWRVIVGLVVLTLVTAIVVGIFPALRASRRDVQNDLHGVNSTASASQARTRETLVVAQLAITLVFLVGAGLFLRTVHALRQVPLGFGQQNVLTGGIVLHSGSAVENGKPGMTNVVRTSYMPLVERLRAIPGVREAALSSVLPMRSDFGVFLSMTLDHQEPSPADQPKAQGRLATAGLVHAMGIPMVRGRFFNEDDGSTAPVVVVINQAFANRYLHGVDPIGHVVSMGKGRFEEAHIVGVIGDVKQTDVTKATEPEMYFCLAQIEPGTPLYGIATAFMQVAIRGVVPADALRTQFDKALHEVAPDATTIDVETIHEAVEDSFGSQTLIAYLLEGFAGLALLIASVGLYGLLSFAVAQTLATASLLAAWLPARYAASIQPIEALRSE